MVGIFDMLNAPNYSVIKFKTYQQALNYRKKFTAKYGYTPELFRIENEFVIVKPNTLQKI